MVAARPNSFLPGVGETRSRIWARCRQTRPTASVSVAAENASARQRTDGRGLRSDDVLNPDLAAIEGARVARLRAFDRGIERRRSGNAHQLIAIAGEAVGRDGDDELSSCYPDNRSFFHGRLGPEIDPLKLCD